jgi:hypothetical protein
MVGFEIKHRVFQAGEGDFDSHILVTWVCNLKLAEVS